MPIIETIGEAKHEQSEEIRVLTHFNTSRALPSDHGMTVAKKESRIASEVMSVLTL
jgi:hypothetical protein